MQTKPKPKHITGGDYRRILLARTREFNKATDAKNQSIIKLRQEKKELMQRLDEKEAVLEQMAKQDKILAVITICFTVVSIANLIMLLK